MHRGHLQLFAQCRKIAGPDGEVVVSVNPDEFVAEFKGQAPIQSTAERMELVGSCRNVDRVLLNSGGTDSKIVIAAVMPDFVVIGQDWALKDYYAQLQVTEEWLDSVGVLILYTPRTTGQSTTNLKTAIAERS